MSTAIPPASQPVVPTSTQLLQRLWDSASPALTGAFEAALGRFDDALFDRAERAGTSQMAFMDGMRELRRRRPEIIAGFRAHLHKAWQAMLACAPLSVEHVLAPPEDGSLSLVSDEELESRLAARNFASAILREHKPVLLRIEQRLGRIAGVGLDSEHDPLGPDHIAVAVGEGFAGCELALEVRLVVLKLCERELASELGRVYDKLDQMLASVAPSAETRPSARGSGAARQDATAPALAAGDTGMPAWAAHFANRMPGPHGSVPGGGLAGASATDASSQNMLLEVLHHFLQESRGIERESSSSLPEQASHSLSRKEMLSVLSLLQSAPDAAISDADESLARRLKQEVLVSAVRLGMDPSTARLSQTDEDAIDLVGMLFDVMLDERDLEGRSRELIGRLAVPFVKVAMLDRHMFVQKDHPARRLLNALAEACEGNSGETAAERTLMAKVEEIVERLVAEFNENLAIFMTLEEEFREFLGQHRRRIEIAERRAAEIQRGQERLEAARTRMEAELGSRLGERTMPQAVEEFMRQPWAHHVTMTLLREGEDGEGLREALALADGVLQELDEAQTQAIDRPWLQAWRPALLKVFSSVGLGADAAEGAIDALHDTLQSVAQARPDLARPLPELPPVSLPKAVDAEATPVQLVGGTDTLEDFDPTDAEHFRSLPIGNWLDFIDKENRVQPGKLSWVSPISSRLLFVNRRGVRFCVASPEELAVMVKMGRLRKHRDEDAFDNAMLGVIDRLGGGRAVPAGN